MNAQEGTVVTLDVSGAELDRASEFVTGLLGRFPHSADLHRAARELDVRLRVAVRGRAGTGRDTMARAVRRQLGVTPIGPGDDDTDADVWLYVLVGWPRPADRVALRGLPPERTVLALGKADTLGSWDDAAQTADACARDLGRSVRPTMPLLACADLVDDEFELLAQMLRDDEPMPSMAAHFISGDRAERTLRIGLLRRLDQFGILSALDLLEAAAEAGSPLDRPALEALLHRQSGVSALADPLAATLDAVRLRRLHRVVASLDRVAASGTARDEIEHTLSRLVRVDA
ncbi:hypothetical protein [Williamsia phyllosphaerae]|uniref:Uncharacterized protein n=1 Tax=Williamsia phyllosphaerae TaxID=885042 RepID=A0ABQ1UDQ2_9NOCA|nr:hypothetical protein [Williamsia phyllosphaerae]GGF14076.1 hypothetical protein GCM10007298_07590 [Williamsia phyllosphaerae]